MKHPIPQLPWQAVASDCIEMQDEHYLVLVDLYSDYIELVQLPDMSSKTLIQQIKPIFATHGTPAVLISDNGTNYSSQEFQEFTKAWEIYHVTVSPHHHKSNGKVESAVKIMKKVIIKAKKDGSDLWKSLLEWMEKLTNSRNIQLTSTTTYVPPTRSMLPSNQALYKPEVQAAVTEQIIQNRKQAKHYHDRTAKSLPSLVVGQQIRVKVHPQQAHSNWKAGTAVSMATTPRSYVVQVNGRTYRRNRVHLRDAQPDLAAQDHSAPRPSHKATKSSGMSTCSLAPEPSGPGPLDATAPVLTEPVVTRSGRVVKPPQRLINAQS
ncbi:uncharacterized protein K02A2.6 [Nematostella vectensis]|uniref:uncharacterized protein K02A2.6 n=1 Tax=Nematostella vectensis TaxID=45351 RepID=UPI0013900D04|nr:uncharacterized protein K02A2.6 [Nematostella vectensis]